MKYAYRCIDCGEETELDYPVGKAPEKFYPSRDQNDHRWHRIYQTAGVVFKGPGFFTTDSRPYKDSIIPERRRKQ